MVSPFKKMSCRRSRKSFACILSVFRPIFSDCSAGFPAVFLPLFIPPAFIPFSRYPFLRPAGPRQASDRTSPCNQYRQEQRLKFRGVITKKEDAFGASRLITKGAPPLYPGNCPALQKLRRMAASRDRRQQPLARLPKPHDRMRCKDRRYSMTYWICRGRSPTI